MNFSQYPISVTHSTWLLPGFAEQALNVGANMTLSAKRLNIYILVMF